MHLFLIRHGETEHNVAGLLAGVTDSKLTNHGVLQTQKLAKHLVNDRQLTFGHIFASDLQRAFMTAEEIHKAQSSLENPIVNATVVQLQLLREQDFGSLELVSWSSRHEQDQNSKLPKPTDPDFKPKETADAMKKRATNFLEDFIVPLNALDEEEEVRIAIVSHGLFLGSLWKTILAQFAPGNVILSPVTDPVLSGRPLEHIPSWTNTGYLELWIKSSDPTVASTTLPGRPEGTHVQPGSYFGDSTLRIDAVNCKDHLANLKRTRGGVGSAAFDQRQRSIDLFFKKPKLERKGEPS